MFLDAIRRLYDYQREVTDHVLNVVAQLSNEEFVSSIVEGYRRSKTPFSTLST